MELQVSGPKGSEIIRKVKLQKSRERVQIPIPQVVDEEGGSFQIDLVSVEDVHGCKKALAVPGMSVNVRRIKVRLCTNSLMSRLRSPSQALASTRKMDDGRLRSLNSAQHNCLFV